ncbi:hypothetical protein Ae201684_007490 [Aphanomyces euteiches]|uniref:Uncharacterized protein n=1 Tax=Aphanomyces euteiches TaxID=100861 RepID=A0A6G0X8U2_9STRA|nr:hypothetical protein Ae201684_007490 [Aphanomyces euteiches]
MSRWTDAESSWSSIYEESQRETSPRDQFTKAGAAIRWRECLSPIVLLDAISSPGKAQSPVTPSKSMRPTSLRTRKLEDQSVVYDPLAATLLNPAYEIDLTLLEADSDKIKQLSQAAESHVEAIYANNAKERMFFKQVSSEMANMEQDIVARHRAATQEKQAWAAERTELEARLAHKDMELHANERERSKLSETLTQTMQYFTHEIEAREARLAAQAVELQTTRDVLSATEQSLRQSQMQQQRINESLVHHVDDLDKTKQELQDSRLVVTQLEQTIAAQAKQISDTDAALATARNVITYVILFMEIKDASILCRSLETKCADQKGTLHAYKEEMHSQSFNVDQLRRQVKAAQDKQDELAQVIKNHEKTIAGAKKAQAKWDAARATFEADQAEHRSMAKMYKERIDAQAKLIRRHEESIVASTVTHMADTTTIDLQTSQLKSFQRSIEDQAAFIAKLEATCRAAEIQHLKNRSMIELLQTKIHGMDEMKSRQEKDIAALQERLVQREGLLEARAVEIDTLKATARDLQHQLELKQQTLDGHERSIDALKTSQDELTTAKTALESQLNDQHAVVKLLNEKLKKLWQEFATSEDSFIHLRLQRSLEEAHYDRERKNVAVWIKTTLDELNMQREEAAMATRMAAEAASSEIAALRVLLEESHAAFRACEAQSRSMEADYVAKVNERTLALEEMEERIHLLEIQLKMNAEQAHQRRQTAHEERQREMAQFQMQLKGKEDVFDIELSRLKAQIQQERAAALEQRTALQEDFERQVSKLTSQLQQERTQATATIAALNDSVASLTLEGVRALEHRQELETELQRQEALVVNRIGMLDEELCGRDRALLAALEHAAELTRRFQERESDLNDQHARESAAMSATHAELLAKVHAEHVDALRGEKDNAAAVKRQLCEEMEALRASHAEKEAQLTDDAMRQRVELEARLVFQKETLTGQLKALKVESDSQLVEQRVRFECLLAHQKETLQGQLDELKVDAATTEATLKTTYESRLVELKTDLESQLDKQRASYEEVISQQRERYESTVRHRKERYETEISAVRTDLEAQLAAQKATLENELERTARRLETALSDQTTHWTTEIAAQKEFYETQMAHQRTQFDADVQTLTAQADSKLTSVTTEFEAQIAALQAAHASQSSEDRAAFEKQRRELEAQLMEQKQELETQIQTQAMEYEAELRRQKTEMELASRTQLEELEALSKSTQEGLEAALSKLQSAMEAQQVDYECRLAAQLAQFQEQLNALQEKYDHDMAALRTELEHAIKTQREELEALASAQKTALEAQRKQETAALNAEIARQRDDLEMQIAAHVERYNTDMAAQHEAFERDLYDQKRAFEAKMIDQTSAFEAELAALQRSGQVDRDNAKQEIESVIATAQDAQQVAAKRIQGLESDVVALQDALQATKQAHETLCMTYSAAVAKHQEAVENADAAMSSLRQNIATLEAHLAQCFTGDFVLSRVKQAVAPLVQEQFHPRIGAQCAAMTSLEDLDALLVKLLELAVDCQTVVQVGKQALPIETLETIVHEYDALWHQVDRAMHPNVDAVVRAVHEFDHLVQQVSLVVPEIAVQTTRSVSADVVGMLQEFQTLRRDAARHLSTTAATSVEILQALQAWQSCRTNVARALRRTTDDADVEKDMVEFIQEYMGLRDNVCRRLELREVDAATILEHVETFESCLSQGKAILSTDALDTTTLLARLDEYEQLKSQVAGLLGVKKDAVQASVLLAKIQDLTALFAQLSTLFQDSGGGVMTVDVVFKIVEEYHGLRCRVAGIWNQDATASKMLETIQDAFIFHQDVAKVLQDDHASYDAVLDRLKDDVALRTQAVNLLDAPPCTTRSILDALDAFQTLRADVRRLWTSSPSSSSPLSSPKEILGYVQDHHGLCTRVSVLLGKDETSTVDDIVHVVQSHLDLSVKHRDLIRAKMTLDANYNALTTTLDAARHQLHDMELRMATVRAKFAFPVDDASFFDMVERKLQEGKDFEMALHRRKQLHEQDVTTHAATVASMTREAKIALENLTRDCAMKIQDAERAAALDMAATKRACALQLEDLHVEQSRKVADLERTMASRVDALTTELTNVRLMKLKEQEEYDATMDKINRALEEHMSERRRRDGGAMDKATMLARYIERDRMLMELVYGSIRSVTQLLTPPKSLSNATMPTEMSHAILGCIKELKRMKEYVIGSFDALQKDVAPFLPFEIQWQTVEYRAEMDMAQWCMESMERMNEYARMHFQLFLTQANTTLTMLAATHRERALQVLAFMRRNVAKDDKDDACLLQLRLVDAMTDRDQVSMELQLKETFFQDLLHQHAAISADMLARLTQHQQLWKAAQQTIATTPKTPMKQSTPTDLAVLKPLPKPKWQEEDPTTILSNGRTLKERFVSDLALETGQNPTSSSSSMMMGATNKRGRMMEKTRPWFQGVRYIDGQSVSIAIALNPTHTGLVVDLFHTDTETMQAVQVHASLLLARGDKPLMEYTPADQTHVTEAILKRLKATSTPSGGIHFCLVDDGDVL